MPILYFLKEPPMTLGALGELTPQLIKRIAKRNPVISTQAPDGKKMLIFIDKESNVAYIKEITKEQLEKMREKQKEQQEEKRIAPPPPGFRIPGRKGGQQKH